MGNTNINDWIENLQTSILEFKICTIHVYQVPVE